MTKENIFSMTTTLEHVVVTTLGKSFPKNNCVHDIFGWRFLKIVWRRSINVIIVKIFSKKRCAHLTLFHPIVIIGPFSKWGIDFMTCKPTFIASHNYIIVVVDYFTKWVEANPTSSIDAKIATLFIFNHSITRFGVPKSIVSDHGSHFCNAMMNKLATLL